MPTTEVTRWSVRVCSIHGIVNGLCTRCPMRPSPNPECVLSEPFEVVRARGARTSDPTTSQLAALQNAPKRGTQRAKVLEAIGSHPRGITSGELDGFMPFAGCWKRVSELKQGGHIHVIGQREVNGTSQDVYVATRDVNDSLAWHQDEPTTFACKAEDIDDGYEGTETLF